MGNEIPNPKTSTDAFALQMKMTLAEKGPAEGLKTVIATIKQHLPPQSKKFDTLVLLAGRYQELLQRKHRNVISEADQDLEFSQLSEALLEFINHLQAADFDEKPEEGAAGAAAGKVDARVGKVLYSIPPRMQVNEETECRVWIAFDLEELQLEIESVSNPELRDVRVSSTMGVELFDHHKNEAFEIVTYDEQIQHIEEGLPTQWTFFVTPLKEGKFPLILKISIVLMNENNERTFKTVVLREIVQITTTEPAEEVVKAPVKEAQQFQFLLLGGAAAGQGAGEATEPPPTSKPPGPAAAPAYLKPLAWTTGALLIAAGIWWVSRGPAADAAAWEAVRRSSDTTALKNFMADFPESPFLPEAELLLTEWRDFGVLLPKGTNDDTESEPDAPRPEGEDSEGTPTDEPRPPDGEAPAPIDPEPELPAEPEPPSEPAPPAEPGEPAPEEQASNPTTIPEGETPALPSPDAAPVPSTPTPETIETVDYRMAATKPLHPDCWEGGSSEKEKCTRLAIMNTVIRGLKAGNLAGLDGASCKLSFIISKTGAVSGIEVLETSNESLSRQVSTILQDLPDFIPGRNGDGEPIDVRYTLPVRVG